MKSETVFTSNIDVVDSVFVLEINPQISAFFSGNSYLH